MKHIAWPVLLAVALLPACDGCSSKRKTVAAPCTTNADCNLNQVCNGTECVDGSGGGSSGMASSGTSSATSVRSSSASSGATSSVHSSGTSLPATSSAVSAATSSNATSEPASSSSGPVLDVTPPFIISTTPSNLEANLPRATAITVVFSEQMDDATVGIVTQPSYPQFADHVPGSLQWSFTTTGGYPTGTTVTVTVSGLDLAGNALSAPTQFSFSTIPNNWDVVNWDEATWQ